VIGKVEITAWVPGTRLHRDAARTHLTLRTAIDGALIVKDHRYRWLPAAPRHRLGLRPGDRVLLARPVPLIAGVPTAVRGSSTRFR
jgi:hypothetical protein